MIYANKTSYFATFSSLKRLILQPPKPLTVLFCNFHRSKLHKIAKSSVGNLHIGGRLVSKGQEEN